MPFATSSARLGENLAVGNGSGLVSKVSKVTSSGNNWGSGVATALQIHGCVDDVQRPQVRRLQPDTTFLATASTTIGATMN